MPGAGWHGTPEDGTIAVSEAKRKIKARQLILVAILIFLIVGILATYNGAAHLLRWGFWKSNYDGVYTDEGRWTEENVAQHFLYGLFFTITGVLGLIGVFALYLWGLSGVMEDNSSTVKLITLPFAIIGFLPSPGLVIAGLLLLFVFLMYAIDSFDLFGLILEDVARPRAMLAAAMPMDSRAAYATAYQQQKSLYTDDYSQAAYGGGMDAYGDLGVDASAPSMVDDLTVPICSGCGKPTEWIEEYQRYYCYDCDRYV